MTCEVTVTYNTTKSYFFVLFVDYEYILIVWLPKRAMQAMTHFLAA